MINRVVLVGRLTKDPELKYTPNGIAVARFTLAVNRTFTSSQSNEREADFINVVVWRKQAENSANFLRKGSLAGVEGRIQTSNFEGQDGKRVFMTEVVADSVQFLEPKKDGQGQQQNPQSNQQSNQSGQTQQYNQSQQSNQSQGNYQREDSEEYAYSGGGGSSQYTDDDLPF